MLHPLMLIVVIGLIGRDLVGPIVSPPIGSGVAAASVLGALLVVALTTHLLLVLVGRQLDRTGEARWIARADLTLAGSRLAIGAIFLVGVFVLDWLGAVRGMLGDWVGVDEVIAGLPPVLAYAVGWWSYAPIERRLHDATLLRALDAGAPIHAFPTRWAYMVERLRSTALGALAPIMLILFWSEAVVMAAGRWGGLDDGGQAGMTLALAGAQLLGAVLVLALSPPLIVWIWGARPLAQGSLHERIEALCRREGVRVGSVRLWRTRGLVLNAAVLGLLPGLRTLLLTDGLVERLDERQLDAVVLHEIAHVRQRHMPWLIATLAAGFGVALVALDLIERGLALIAPAFRDAAPAWFDAIGFGGSILQALWIFGVVSRLFERQADSFAAASLARADGGDRVTTDAAEAMASALERVARLNHIPLGKYMWRHGSIATRCMRLRALVGAPVAGVRVDRLVRRIKVSVAVTLVVVAGVIASMVVDPAQPISQHAGGPEPEPTAP